MDKLNPRFQNQSPIVGEKPYGTTTLWLGVLAHRRHCGEICEHLQAPVAQLREQWRFQEEHQKLQELFDKSQEPIYLHQQGCLAREATEYRLARLHFIAEQALLAPDAHAALAANRYELALIATLQEHWTEAQSLAREGKRHALAAKDEYAVCEIQSLLATISSTLAAQPTNSL